MELEWDEAKNDENIRKHGFDFTDADEIFEEPMLTWLDQRHDYGEDPGQRLDSCGDVW